MSDPVAKLIERWKQDSGGTYQTWFLWEERLKNFRSIRRGLAKVIEEIESGEFGNTYRDSSLETVVHSISEQRQIFKGADHAFIWKPKLRIPDIYENRDNQIAFGRFLSRCLECSGEAGVLDAIHRLDSMKIKGLGPAACNLLYFLHPTVIPPFNTAIVDGYNALTGSKVKLGKWSEYLAMRAGIVRLNEEHKDLLSNDYGAIGGLLYDLGCGRYLAPPRGDDKEMYAAWEKDLQKVKDESATVKKIVSRSQENEKSHTELQGWLRDLGLALGFDVWIASNDRSRPYLTGRLCDGCLGELPTEIKKHDLSGSIALIDVLWFDRASSAAVAAFEVEHSTSIYSGILRMLDLAQGGAGSTLQGLFLVAPDDREGEVRQQVHRPAFQSLSGLKIQYLPYGELEKHREPMAKFGAGLKAVQAVARPL